MHLSYLLLCLSCSCVLAYSRDPDLDVGDILPIQAVIQLRALNVT